MRIGIFTDAYPPEINGVATVAKTLYNIFKDHGHEVFVITTARGKQKKDVMVAGNLITIKGITLKKLYGYKLTRFFSPKGLNVIRNLNLDVIHMHTELGVGMFAKIVAKLLNIPLVYTYHTMYEDYTYYVTKGRKYFDLFGKMMIRKWSKVMALSCTEYCTTSYKTKEVLRGYGINRYINVVPNGIDLSQFEIKNFNKEKADQIIKQYHLENKYLILSLGRVAEEKSIDVVIKSFANYLHNEEKDCVLLIAGDGPAKRSLEQLTRELGIEDKVLFLGKFDHAEVGTIYRIADLFVSASLTETQGLTFLEAMASDTIVLGRFDDNLVPVINDGISGFFFTDDFDEKLKMIINLDEEKAKEIKINAHKVLEKFSLETFYDRMEEVYERAIRKGW